MDDDDDEDGSAPDVISAGQLRFTSGYMWVVVVVVVVVVAVVSDPITTMARRLAP